MNKPNNYDQTSTGTYTPVALGGHKAVIKDVKVQQAKNGKKMIVVSIDFDNSDIQPKYFENEYRNSTKEPKKWPINGVKYIMVENNEGNTNRDFKGFVTAYEDSNKKEVVWNADDVWCMQFKNSRIGVVYREEESWYQDKISVSHKIAWFCDYAKALDSETPKRREYKGDMGTQTNVLPESTDFMTIPEGFDDGLPFN